jgi:hypothetical protein
LNIGTKRAIIKVKRTKNIDLFGITIGEYSRYVVNKAHKSHKSDIYIEKYIDTIGDALKSVPSDLSTCENKIQGL